MDYIDTIINGDSEIILKDIAPAKGAVTDLERKLFWAETNAAYAELRANPEAWAEELAERKVWEATLVDGLRGIDHAHRIL